jgi:hypothetical protein
MTALSNGNGSARVPAHIMHLTGFRIDMKSSRVSQKPRNPGYMATTNSAAQVSKVSSTRSGWRLGVAEDEAVQFWSKLAILGKLIPCWKRNTCASIRDMLTKSIFGKRDTRSKLHLI